MLQKLAPRVFLFLLTLSSVVENYWVDHKPVATRCRALFMGLAWKITVHLCPIACSDTLCINAMQQTRYTQGCIGMHATVQQSLWLVDLTEGHFGKVNISDRRCNEGNYPTTTTRVNFLLPICRSLENVLSTVEMFEGHIALTLGISAFFTCAHVVRSLYLFCNKHC